MSDELSNERFRRYLLQYNTGEVLADPLLHSLRSGDIIGKILSKRNVTPETFRNMIQLLLVPERLLLLQNTQILPALMSLLRSHCRRCRPFDDEYGFSCFEAIVFVLGIGVLAESRYLNQYIEEAAKLPGPRSTHSDYITMVDCVEQFLPSEDQQTNTAWGFDATSQMLAPALGGFTMSDLRFVVNTLWENRKPMFSAHTIAGTSPGWWCGLYLLWIFNERTLKDHALTDRIYAVALRLEVNSSGDKPDLLNKAMFALFQKTTRERLSLMKAALTPVDAEDAEHVLAKYYQYVHDYHRRTQPTLGLAVVWAGDVVRWLDDLGVYLKYLDAHIETLWAGIVREDDMPDDLMDGTPDRTAIILVAELFLRHAERIIGKVEPGSKAMCIRMIFKKGDFVNLMGRLIIWFSRVDVPEEMLDHVMEQANSFNSALISLTATAKSFTPRYFDNDAYIFEGIADWNKMLCFLDDSLHLTAMAHMHAIERYLTNAINTWSEFSDMAPKTYASHCALPTCDSGTQPFACGGCNRRYYCNRTCQARHWYSRTTGLPHWLECNRIE